MKFFGVDVGVEMRPSGNVYYRVGAEPTDGEPDPEEYVDTERVVSREAFLEALLGDIRACLIELGGLDE